MQKASTLKFNELLNHRDRISVADHCLIYWLFRLVSYNDLEFLSHQLSPLPLPYLFHKLNTLSFFCRWHKIFCASVWLAVVNSVSFCVWPLPEDTWCDQWPIKLLPVFSSCFMKQIYTKCTFFKKKMHFGKCLSERNNWTSTSLNIKITDPSSAFPAS